MEDILYLLELEIVIPLILQETESFGVIPIVRTSNLIKFLKGDKNV